MKRESRANSVIGHRLQCRVLDRRRKFTGQLSAPVSIRKNQARTNSDRSNSRVFRTLPAKTIDILVFARYFEFQTGDGFFVANEIIAGSAAPNEIIGKVILM